MAAVGEYYFTNDDTFVLVTPYDRASTEEKIWFGNANLRFRISQSKTSDGTGVIASLLASEVRDLSGRDPSEESSIAS